MPPFHFSKRISVSLGTIGKETKTLRVSEFATPGELGHAFRYVLIPPLSNEKVVSYERAYSVTSLVENQKLNKPGRACLPEGHTKGLGSGGQRGICSSVWQVEGIDEVDIAGADTGPRLERWRGRFYWLWTTTYTFWRQWSRTCGGTMEPNTGLWAPPAGKRRWTRWRR